MFDVIWPALIGLFGVYWIVRALMTGIASTGGYIDFEKKVEPGNYWAFVSLTAIISAVGFGMAGYAYLYH